MSMIDELVKAIDEASIAWSKENHGLSKWDVPSDLIARAVLRRLREPTDAMLAAGTAAITGGPEPDPDYAADAEAMFAAMIDAALGEKA